MLEQVRQRSSNHGLHVSDILQPCTSQPARRTTGHHLLWELLLLHVTTLAALWLRLLLRLAAVCRLLLLLVVPVAALLGIILPSLVLQIGLVIHLLKPASKAVTVSMA